MVEYIDNSKIGVLIIGSLPPPLGGTAVSLYHLVNYLNSRNDINVYIVNTGYIKSSNYYLFIKKLFNDLKMVLYYTRKSDIITLHIGTRSLPYFGIIILIISKIFGKPLIVRKFNGTDTYDLKLVEKYLSHIIIKKSNLYLAQTKQLVQSASQKGISHVKWLPTSRNMAKLNNVQKNNKCRKYIFLGQVRKQKGVPQLLKAADRMPIDVIIDVYGPLGYDIKIEMFMNNKTNYKGIVEPDNVTELLMNYDVLVLPTYHPGEGYPGVIMEAFSAGIPVITTRWKSIPELIDDKTGILVKPMNVESLYLAMLKLYNNSQLYLELKKGILAKRKKFSSDIWNNFFVEHCKKLKAD